MMKRHWARDELADHWILGPTELELLANKGGATRLGFAILLKAFTIEGRFPRQKQDVPLVLAAGFFDHESAGLAGDGSAPLTDDEAASGSAACSAVDHQLRGLAFKDP
jgi:hypothetical protein